MARRAGSGYRWLTIALLSGACGAPAATAPPASADPPAQAKKGKSLKMDKTASAQAPEQALLDYLGRYEDAADGLDPLGLAEPDAEPPAGNDRKERP